MIVWSIARNTFREAVRDKIMYLLFGFAVLMILVSRAIGWVSYGGELKIMADMGLTSIWLFTAMISIFIGTGMIYKEIDKRTLYTILSKPIERWQFVLGKYMGLLLTSLTCLTLLSVIFVTYLWLVGAPVTLAIAQALLLTGLEMCMVTALAIFFSSVSSPVLSAIFTFSLFGLGQLTKWIVEMGEVAARTSPMLKKLIMGFYLLMPNLHNFNARREAVHAAGRGEMWALSPAETQSVVLYGLAYTAAVLLAAVLVFRRRNF